MPATGSPPPGAAHRAAKLTPTEQTANRALSAARAPVERGIPIVVADSAEEIGDLELGEFRTLWQVLRALRAHDEALGIELDTQRSHASTANPQLPSRVTIQLPPGSADSLLAQLTALTVRQTTSPWWTGYGYAAAYHAVHGHLAMHSGHVTADGFRLGQWIGNARQHRRKGWLQPDRVEALDKMGMLWDTPELPWHRFLDELRSFRSEFGHVLVPQAYTTPDGYRLGNKINSTRNTTHRVPDFVRRALDDLGMVWDTRDLRWQQLYTACQQYATIHGHLDVPASYTTPDGYTLGTRLKGVRRAAEQGRLDPAERTSLEELGMAFASSDDRAWADFLDACDRYITAHGSLATVEKAYTDDTGYRLGARISYYRNLNNGTKTGGIPPQRRTALDGRGMVWRVAPARDLHPDEQAGLQELTGSDLGAAIVQLIDDEGVTQSSIAAALGTHRSYLNTKIKAFRETGTWPDRRPSRTRQIHAQR